MLFACADFLQETLDTLMDYIEKYIMTRLYRALFCPVITDDEEKDLAIQNRFRSLHWINAHILDAQIDEMQESVRELVDQAITGTCWWCSVITQWAYNYYIMYLYL